MTARTLFTRIIDGEIPGQFVHQDEHCIAIRDINPAAPVHLLVIPRKPIASLAQLTAEDHALGGQTVPHLHLHLMGGRALTGHGTA